MSYSVDPQTMNAYLDQLAQMRPSSLPPKQAPSPFGQGSMTGGGMDVGGVSAQQAMELANILAAQLGGQMTPSPTGAPATTAGMGGLFTDAAGNSNIPNPYNQLGTNVAPPYATSGSLPSQSSSQIIPSKPGTTAMYDPKTGQTTILVNGATPGTFSSSTTLDAAGHIVSTSVGSNPAGFDPVTNAAATAAGLPGMPNLGSLIPTPPGAPAGPGLPATAPGTTGATTIQDLVDQAGGYGFIPGLGVDPATQVSPFGSSGLGVNEQFMNENIWSNPELALQLSGVASPGTPGYNNLANLGFDPLMVYYAATGDRDVTGTKYAQWLANMYKTLGTRGDQGGGSITAGPLLANLVNMSPTTELGKMMSDDPTVFYQMATQVMDAGGASPMATAAFKSQMAGLYTEYLAYSATVTTSDKIKPINQWIKDEHPDIVASWTGGA